MAVLPHILVGAALKAPHHIQVAVAGVLPPPGPGPGTATVVGEVARVFRGPLAVGTPVRVAVHVLRDGDAPPPSGILWTPWADLVAARVLELWGDDGDDGRLHVVGSQSVLCDTPSDEPRHPLDEAQARPPRETPRERLDRAGLGLGGLLVLTLITVAIVGGFGVALAALLR
jgi:hypothetical protein